MRPVRKPTLQQATALVSLSTCGAMTGFAFAHGTVDEMTSPTRMPVRLLALDKPAAPASTGDGALRSAIVKVATNYLRMAQTRNPSEMEALIWGTDSIDGVDHGESCAAFASLTLELGANVVGQHSWVTGGTTYPWPLHKWADVRVNPNPSSLGVTSGSVTPMSDASPPRGSSGGRSMVGGSSRGSSITATAVAGASSTGR